VAYNFQIGKNKINLLTKYESVTKKVLLFIESMLQNTKQLQQARLLLFPVLKLQATETPIII
jgi:hypothetical protein